jgi:hypothetical protein
MVSVMLDECLIIVELLEWEFFGPGNLSLVFLGSTLGFEDLKMRRFGIVAMESENYKLWDIS